MLTPRESIHPKTPMALHFLEAVFPPPPPPFFPLKLSSIPHAFERRKLEFGPLPGRLSHSPTAALSQMTLDHAFRTRVAC